MKFYKFLIQNGNDEPDYGVCTEAELVAKLRKIAEDTAEHKCRTLPPELVEAFDSGNFSTPPHHFEIAEKGQLVPHPPAVEIEFMSWLNGEFDTEEFCAPPADLTVSWEHEPRVQAFADSLDAALTEADEMKSQGIPEPGWGPEARAALAAHDLERFKYERWRDSTQVNPDIHNPHNSVGC